jgi:hypothetical protein
MAGTRTIDQLPNGGAIAGTETAPAYQSGTTVKFSIDTIKNYVMTFVTTALALKLNIAPRVFSQPTSASPTPNADTTDLYIITNLDTDTTFGAPTGSPAEGQRLTFRITSDGTIRNLLFNSVYSFSAALPAPSATVANETLYMEFMNNAGSWQCINLIGGF